MPHFSLKNTADTIHTLGPTVPLQFLQSSNDLFLTDNSPGNSRAKYNSLINVEVVSLESKFMGKWLQQMPRHQKVEGRPSLHRPQQILLESQAHLQR